MRTVINDQLISWASDIEPGTLRQAEKTARLPIIAGHVALMPDAHVGIGATVGSVIPTRGAVIPAAVGVDIGCGMIAAELDVHQDQLPDDLEPLLARIARVIPAGMGQGHGDVGRRADRWLAEHRPATDLSGKQAVTAAKQFGTLGSGNHFVEVCLDERDVVWVVLHSGSRGIGNQLAQMHIASARRLAKDLELRLEDRAVQIPPFAFNAPISDPEDPETWVDLTLVGRVASAVGETIIRGEEGTGLVTADYDTVAETMTFLWTDGRTTTVSIPTLTHVNQARQARDDAERFADDSRDAADDSLADANRAGLYKNSATGSAAAAAGSATDAGTAADRAEAASLAQDAAIAALIEQDTATRAALDARYATGGVIEDPPGSGLYSPDPNLFLEDPLNPGLSLA